MLIIAGEIVVDPGAVDQVREALKTMEDESRKEAGCLTYAFSVDINDPTKVRLTEHWESMAALEEHFASPHMAAFGAAVGAIQPRAIDIKAYEIKGEVTLPG
jgi:quinol monooxygenase YgiN